MSVDKHDPHAPAPNRPTEIGGIHAGVAAIGFIFCFLAGIALMYAYDRRSGAITADLTTSGASVAAWADNDAPIPVDSKDPVWGKREAPVTMVLFSDYQCPYCSRVEKSFEQVKTEYGPDKVRIVWKNRPLSFHPNAKPAAEAGEGVFQLKGNDAFWKFHKLAFDNQKDLSRESYEKWAAAVGVPMPAFKAGLDSHKWAAKVEADDAIANKIGAGGTPATFVNGVKVGGAVPYEQFKKVIDEQLTKAAAKASSGTSKDKLYVALTKDQFTKEAEKEEEKEDNKTIWKVSYNPKLNPVLGTDKALVTIQVFSDFQCPYCGRVEPTFAKIRETYGEKVRFVWRNEPLPFHPRAKPAAELAWEARAEKGDKGFWEAHDKLFEIQKGGLADADLEKLAGDLKLDVAKVKAAIKDEKYKKEIEADHKVAQEFQVNGTPHMFVNGRRISGAVPFESFKPIIDEEIKRAEGLLASGVKQDALYDTLIKDGKTAPPPPPAPELEKKTVALPTNAPTKGGSKAKVVIQEFSDFQCPYCSRVEPTVDQITKEYGDKVKFVWRNLPLPMHPDAPLAAEAAMEAFKQKGSDGFWKLHGVMFKNQQALKRENLEKYAADIGLDVTKFKAALDNHTHQATVEADKKAGNDAGIQGTPAFIINGYFVNGAQPFENFKTAIDKALAEAK